MYIRSFLCECGNFLAQQFLYSVIAASFCRNSERLKGLTSQLLVSFVFGSILLKTRTGKTCGLVRDFHNRPCSWLSLDTQVAPHVCPPTLVSLHCSHWLPSCFCSECSEGLHKDIAVFVQMGSAPKRSTRTGCFPSETLSRRLGRALSGSLFGYVCLLRESSPDFCSGSRVTRNSHN